MKFCGSYHIFTLVAVAVGIFKKHSYFKKAFKLTISSISWRLLALLKCPYHIVALLHQWYCNEFLISAVLNRIC